MFFKKAFLFFFLFSFSPASYAKENFFAELTCTKIVKNFYPFFIRGELGWENQEKFFRCLHDFLELIVDKKIFTHDPGRDYFTRREIFKMFHWYFEYESETSTLLTDKVFFIKKALIGGSMDKLKDSEIAVFRRLIYDNPRDDDSQDDSYQTIYYILHKQIPVFRKAFFEESTRITPKEREKALDQLRKAFILLGRAYTRENIVYRIDDLYKYDEYLKKAQIIESPISKSVKQPFWFAHNLFEGLFSPKKEIKGKDWLSALDTLYKAVDLFLYYKTYFLKDLPSPEFVYRTLEGMEIFMSSLQFEKTLTEKNKKGFPLRNLDEMLSVLFSFFNQDSDSSSFKGSLFANIGQAHSIPLFTRTLSCFSLDKSPEKECESKWGSGPSSPVVTLSFEDAKFEIFPDKIKRSRISGKSSFIEMGKLKALKQWLAGYKRSLLEIDSGNVYFVAKNRQFDHWLSPFFGWEKNSRIKFGAFHASENSEKFYQLLNYQAFLPLLFSSYLPKNFFSSKNEKQASISFETWKQMVKEISPALVVFGGKKGYKNSWRQSFFDLFNFADLFLYSSNRDGLLNAEEFTDLAVHFLEGIKGSRFAYDKISRLCADQLTLPCITEKIVEDQEILAVYPRFQKYLYSSQMEKYKEKIKTILEEGQENQVHALSFVPLFILLQAMELNYELIDGNQSFHLESDEILLFAKHFEERLAEKIPYLLNTDQARAYLMYSFKTGDMPFFTGDGFVPAQFVNWYLDSKKHKAFQISPGDFHFLILDFYKLYQNL